MSTKMDKGDKIAIAIGIIDALQEYGESTESDKIDKDVEIIAWREIEPFEGGERR